MTHISNQRETNIELLRFVLMFLICVWHTLVHGFDYKNMSDSIIPDTKGVLLMGLCVPAVDTFMLIAGFYGIKYSIDKLLRLIIHALLISNTVIIIKYIYCNGNFEFYYQLFPVSSECWWFLSVYIVIMLLSPIINGGIESIKPRLFLQILIPLFFIYSIVQYRLEMNTGGNLITMLLVYLLGRYLNKTSYNLTKTAALLLYFLSFASILAMMYYYYSIGRYDSIWRSLNYNNPLVILMSVSIFYFVKSIKKAILPRTALFLGRHSLSIYLFTEIIGLSLYKYWSGLFEQNLLLFLLSVLHCIILIEFIDVPYLWINTHIRKRILYIIKEKAEK